MIKFYHLASSFYFFVIHIDYNPQSKRYYIVLKNCKMLD